MLEQLDTLTKVSVQWVAASLTTAYRIYRGKLDEETGELALLTLLLLVSVWIEGTKLWVMTAYRCYELGRDLRRKLSSSSPEQLPNSEKSEAVEASKIEDSTETVQDLVTLTAQQDKDYTESASPQPLDSLAHLSSKALKQLAKEKRIKGYGRMTKAQLVAALSC